VVAASSLLVLKTLVAKSLGVCSEPSWMMVW
jgi:hypothetical protein